MSVLEISRVDRVNRSYDLAALFPGLNLTGATATVALLPKGSKPTAATVWTSATIASGTVTILAAGPDADSTGALVVPATADLWIKVTVGTQVDAAKAGRITVFGGAGLIATPVDRGIPAGGTTGQVLAKASNTAYDTAWVAQTGGGGSVVDATATVKGVVQLAGDLGGTAAAPTVPALAGKASSSDPRFTDTRTPTDGSVTDAKVASGAAISADKLADGTTGKILTATERTKLAGVATGATANATDAALRDRSTHTGTQSADTLTDGTTNKAFLATERTKLAGIATGATANSTDATLLARANHTGTQAATTITGLATVATTGVYNDLTGKPTIPTVGVANGAASLDATVNVPLTQLGNAGKYDKRTNLYNALPTGLRRFRARLAAAEAGLGLCDIVICGTSISAGSGSTRTTSWPEYVRAQLASKGYPIGGTGIMAAAGNPADPRVTGAAYSAFSTTDATLGLTSTASATQTYVSDVAGTIVDIYTWEGGGSGSYTYSIDGAAAVTVTIGTSQTIKKTTVTGLSNAVHTVAVTSSATTSGSLPFYILGVDVHQTSGVKVTNLGMAGATSTNIAQTGQSFSPLNVAKNILPGGLVFIEYGANDFDGQAGTTRNNLVTGITNLQPVSDVALMAYAARDTDLNTTNPATTGANAYGVEVLMRTLSDTYGIPVVDIFDRWGPFATQNSYGMFFDTIHPNARGARDIARSAAGLVEIGTVTTAHTHVATTDLTATGTKDATTFLRGDNTWAVPAGGGGGSGSSALGFPSSWPFSGVQSSSQSLNGRIYATRVYGSGTITKLRIYVAASSGNICVGVYAGGTTGPDVQPGTLKATSGTVACPAVGLADVSLGGSVTVNEGDWFAIMASSSTPTFRAAGNGDGFTALKGLGGFTAISGTTLPLPSVLALDNFETKTYLLIGVA